MECFQPHLLALGPQGTLVAKISNFLWLTLLETLVELRYLAPGLPWWHSG